MFHLVAESSSSAFSSLAGTPSGYKNGNDMLFFSQHYGDGGIHFIDTVIQYFRLDCSDWLSSMFLKPTCTLNSPGEVLTNPLSWPDPTLDQLNQNEGGKCGAWASGNCNVQAELRITGLEQWF